MTSTRRLATNLRAAGLVLLSLCQAQCNGDTTEVECLTDLSATGAGRKVQGFIDTAHALNVAATEIDSELGNVCQSMGHALGIPALELAQPMSTDAIFPGAATDLACRRVRLEIGKIVHDNLVANASLAIVSTESACTIDPGARLRCEQQCDPLVATVTRLECTPGQATGTCMSSCMGRCTGACSAGCLGACVGTCAGSCSGGKCSGACNGICDAKNADGSCYGACSGTCTGVCDGSCTGTCDATCGGGCTGACLGTCEGACSSWVDPPRCTQITELTKVPECRTDCAARSHFGASCSQPAVKVSYGYAATTAQKAALDRLLAALRNDYSEFRRVAARAALVMGDAGGGYPAALAGMQTSARQVGLGASACLAAAISRVATDTSMVQVSIDAGAGITASLSAVGGLPIP